MKKVDPGRATQTVRHPCSGNLGIVKILRYIGSDRYTAFLEGRSPLSAPTLPTGPVLKHNGKSGTATNFTHTF